MSYPGRARCALALSGGELTNFAAHLYGSRTKPLYTCDSLAFVRFLDAPSTPPHWTAEVIGAVLASNGSKVVPHRCIPSANSWSFYGLQVVLEPSHLGALPQYPSSKSLAEAYPSVFNRYLSLDALNGPRFALSG